MTDPRVLVITAMRDEGPHLLEWVAHHRAAGVQDFLIVSNDCADGTDALLDLLEGAGIVTHLRNDLPEGRTPQWAALRQAAEHSRTRAADWIAVLDCDEFINLRAPLRRVQDLIAAAGDADAIALSWRLFGHSGHARRPDALTTEAYHRAIPEDAAYPALAGFFKTLYRRAGPFQKPGIHRPKQKPGSLPRWVDGAGRELPDDVAGDASRILLWGRAGVRAQVQLNHYSTRSAEDFMAKRARGLPNHTAKPVGLTYWVERNFNGTEDRSIAHMLPAARDELQRLRSLPGVAQAEVASCAYHRATFAAALRDPAELTLYGRLLLAAGSHPPDAATARQLVALYGQAHQPD